MCSVTGLHILPLLRIWLDHGFAPGSNNYLGPAQMDPIALREPCPSEVRYRHLPYPSQRADHLHSSVMAMSSTSVKRQWHTSALLARRHPSCLALSFWPHRKMKKLICMLHVSVCASKLSLSRPQQFASAKYFQIRIRVVRLLTQRNRMALEACHPIYSDDRRPLDLTKYGTHAGSRNP